MADHHWHSQPYSPLNTCRGKALCRVLSSLSPVTVSLVVTISLRCCSIQVHAWVTWSISDTTTRTLRLEVKYEEIEE